MKKATALGEGEYVVTDGDCIASIAAEHGLLPDALWNLPQNASLASGRADPRVLLPGDRVHIPKIESRCESGETGKRHVFRLNLKETLKMVLLDVDGKPRASLSYILSIDNVLAKSGVTLTDGLVEVAIPPGARSGWLTVKTDCGEEVYALQLGGMDPIFSVSGAQKRLHNLGFHRGAVDGIIGLKTRHAITEFQQNQNLTATGEIDDETWEALERTHGF